MEEKNNLSAGESFAQSFVNGSSDGSVLNKKDGTLPFGYLNPATEGKVYWMCNHDQQNQIVSVFKCDDSDLVQNGVSQDIKILKDMDEARRYRDELVQAGWIEMKDPKNRFFYGGREVEMTRKMKRSLAKKVRKMNKQMGINTPSSSANNKESNDDSE